MSSVPQAYVHYIRQHYQEPLLNIIDTKITTYIHYDEEANFLYCPMPDVWAYICQYLLYDEGYSIRDQIVNQVQAGKGFL